jgi:hypothetical protein
MMGLKKLTGASLLLTLIGFNTSASASLITDGALTLDTNPAQIFQQTEATPCVIGGNNCLNGS